MTEFFGMRFYGVATHRHSIAQWQFMVLRTALYGSEGVGIIIGMFRLKGTGTR